MSKGRTLKPTHRGYRLKRDMDKDNPWGLSVETRIRSTSPGSYPKSIMTMDEVREKDRKYREAFQEEWAPIIEVMES